jgi:hypothetical protein
MTQSTKEVPTFACMMNAMRTISVLLKITIIIIIIIIIITTTIILIIITIIIITLLLLLLLVIMIITSSPSLALQLRMRKEVRPMSATRRDTHPVRPDLPVLAPVMGGDPEKDIQEVLAALERENRTPR